jgi:hypothetical protein
LSKIIGGWPQILRLLSDGAVKFRPLGATSVGLHIYYLRSAKIRTPSMENSILLSAIVAEDIFQKYPGRMAACWTLRKNIRRFPTKLNHMEVLSIN